jgi:hypothetical protein
MPGVLKSLDREEMEEMMQLTKTEPGGGGGGNGGGDKRHSCCTEIRTSTLNGHSG